MTAKKGTANGGSKLASKAKEVGPAKASNPKPVQPGVRTSIADIRPSTGSESSRGARTINVTRPLVPSFSAATRGAKPKGRKVTEEPRFSMRNFTTVILLALICVTIGYLFGRFSR